MKYISIGLIALLYTSFMHSAHTKETSSRSIWRSIVSEGQPSYIPLNVTQDGKGTIYLLAKKNPVSDPAIFLLTQDGIWDEQLRLVKIKTFNPFSERLGTLTYIHAIGNELFAIVNYGAKYTIEKTSLENAAPTWEQIYPKEGTTENYNKLLRLSGDTKKQLWVTYQKNILEKASFYLTETTEKGRFFGYNIVFNKSADFPYDTVDLRQAHVWAINKAAKKLIHEYNGKPSTFTLKRGVEDNIDNIYASFDGHTAYGTNPKEFYIWDNQLRRFKKKYLLATTLDFLPINDESLVLILNRKAQLLKHESKPTQLIGTETTQPSDLFQELYEEPQTPEITLPSQPKSEYSETQSTTMPQSIRPIYSTRAVDPSSWSELEPERAIPNPFEVIEPKTPTSPTITTSTFPESSYTIFQKYILARAKRRKYLDKRMQMRKQNVTGKIQKSETIQQWEKDLQSLQQYLYLTPQAIAGKDYFFAKDFPLTNFSQSNQEIYIMPKDEDLTKVFIAVATLLKNKKEISYVAIHPTPGITQVGWWPFGQIFPRIIIGVNPLNPLTIYNFPKYLKDSLESQKQMFKSTGYKPSFSNETSYNFIYYSLRSFIEAKEIFDKASWYDRLAMLRRS